MTLRVDKKEYLDIQKIHTEINQIVNQRYLITALAVTIFGVIGAWLFPQQFSVIDQNSISISFFGLIVLVLILIILFSVNINLKQMLRCLTAYLIKSDNSIWEKHWQIYRREKKYTYTKGIALIFSFLGIITLLYPFFIGFYNGSINFSLHIDITKLNLIFIVYSSFIGFYFALIIMTSLFGMFDNEDSELRKWDEILNRGNSMVRQVSRPINTNNPELSDWISFFCSQRSYWLTIYIGLLAAMFGLFSLLIVIIINLASVGFFILLIVFVLSMGIGLFDYLCIKSRFKKPNNLLMLVMSGELSNLEEIKAKWLEN
jgi:hypothetical protein